MPKRRNLSIEERAAVVTLSKEKYTGHTIARRLKISLCAVQKILKKVCETGTVKDRPRSGRPSSTTPRQDRLLCHLSLSDRTAKSRDLKRELEDATGSQISCRTVRRKLLKCGLKGCITARKPLHSAVHRKKRLEWCQQRKDLTPEQWKKILFSDESIFELIPGRRAFVRRRKGESFHHDCLVSTVKHGGGKMQVWGCMGASGVGTLKVVTGRLNVAGYVRLICHTLVEDGRKLCVTDFVFQQDGAPLPYN